MIPSIVERCGTIRDVALVEQCRIMCKRVESNFYVEIPEMRIRIDLCLVFCSE